MPVCPPTLFWRHFKAGNFKFRFENAREWRTDALGGQFQVIFKNYSLKVKYPQMAYWRRRRAISRNFFLNYSLKVKCPQMAYWRRRRAISKKNNRKFKSEIKLNKIFEILPSFLIDLKEKFICQGNIYGYVRV